MKSLRLALSACTVLMAEAATAADSARLAIIPAPREMSVTGGECAAKCKPKFEQVASIPPELRGHILGGQGNNWSEYTWNEYDLDWKMWPRSCALAEAVWTGDSKPDFANFRARMETHRKRLIAQGVNCAPLE